MNIKKNIDKFGTAGLFLTAIFSPCCFPLFAFGLSALGFGGFELFGGWTMWIFQAMVIISIVGLYFSYRIHRCMYPLLVAVPSGILVFYGYHFSSADYWTYYLYAGMFGLLIATIWNYQRNRMHRSCGGDDLELASTITCPHCQHQKEELMPTDACQYFYECEKCGKILKPKQGDCCVYCSYGTQKCPPIQQSGNCC
jgi:hypothetical protein